MTRGTDIEATLRELAPQVLGALVRHHGHFDACEDAVQEALLAAARQRPANGAPDRVWSWLRRWPAGPLWRYAAYAVLRSRREGAAAALEAASRPPDAQAGDETLALLFPCLSSGAFPAVAAGAHAARQGRFVERRPLS